MKFRSLFISDVHLGTVFCQSEKLLNFLKSFEDSHGHYPKELEYVYLVGDIVVDSDNKTWWKITIYGDEFEYNFFVNLFDSKEECDKEIKRLIELPYLNLFDLESAGYDL